MDYERISASGHARQHNGNVISEIKNFYYRDMLRRRRSDEVLRDLQRDEGLLYAAADGQTTRVQYLLNQGADIEYSDDLGMTALHHAALGGSEEVVDMLLNAGCDVNAESPHVGTALHLAAINHRVAVVQTLLTQPGIDTNASGRLIGTVLHCVAAVHEDTTILVMLLQKTRSLLTRKATVVPDIIPLLIGNRYDYKGVEIALRRTQVSWEVYECLPLHLAARIGNVGTAKILLETHSAAQITFTAARWNVTGLNRVEYHKKTDSKAFVQGLTALMTAVDERRADLVELLCGSCRNENELSAAVRASDGRRRTALHYACSGRRQNEQNDEEWWHRMLPLQDEWGPETQRCARILLSAGADIDAKDALGRTAVMDASANGNDDLLGLLLEQRAAVNLQAIDGKTAMMCAAQLDQCDVLQRLFSAGALVDLQDNEGYTALHHVAASGGTECMEFLLSQKASVQLKSSTGATALALAVEQGNMDRVTLLLKAGSDPNVARGGRSLLDEALYRGDSVLADLLRTWGAQQVAHHSPWRSWLPVDASNKSGMRLRMDGSHSRGSSSVRTGGAPSSGSKLSSLAGRLFGRRSKDVA